MAAKTPLVPLGLVDQLVERVFAWVLSGDLPQGSEITEGQLASQFGVSRTPVREAIRRLAEMGVVVIRPRCGIEVATFSQDDLRQISVLRAELECLSLRLMLQRASDEQLDIIVNAAGECDQALKSKDRVVIFRADSRFHLLIAEFSGNLHLADALRRLDAKVQLCRMVFCREMRKIRDSVKEHAALTEAIRQRRVESAVELMRSHIMGSLDDQ